MKVYFDACAYNRPYDDFSQMRVRLEAEAVLAIMHICFENDWILISNDVVDLEIAETRDPSKREKVQEFSAMANEKVYADSNTAIRADELQALGFKALDSFHIALAESSNIDVLISTDDKMIKLANRLESKIKVRVANPLNWLSEVLL